jgi:ribosome biogenesis GTPase
MNISTYGWENYQSKIGEKITSSIEGIGRVILEHKQHVILATNYGEIDGLTPRKLSYKLAKSALPKVGDWVIFEKLENEAKGIIKQVLPRFATLSRKEVSKQSKEQIMVTNIDLAFIVMSVDNNFNLSRLERYLLLIQNSGATPIIILTKIDSVNDFAEKHRLAETVAGKIQVISCSNQTLEGLTDIEKLLSKGISTVFLGSSGVGKSTLINKLASKNLQKTKATREADSKGRHTTTSRELFVLPNGAIVIDTPGMRELGNLSSSNTIKDSFVDLDILANDCQYRDCDHNKSQGCNIIKAVKSGKISQTRYNNFLKLLKQARHDDIDHDARIKQARKTADKKVHKNLKKLYTIRNKKKAR